jgi:PIN like domain
MTIKPADTRFYVDADTLGLARILVKLRSDVTFPGDPGGIIHRRVRPPCPIDQINTPDTEWIREIAARGWLIITRDQRIARRYRERTAVTETAARLIAITSKDKLTNWEILEIVMTQWRWIESMVSVPGPFIYGVTRTARTKIL